MTEITRRTALGAAIAIPAAAAMARTALAADPVEIDLFFPVPVQGKLADKMKELIDRFNSQQKRGQSDRRLYGQLRRYQSEDPRRDQGRQTARRGDHVG